MPCTWLVSRHSPTHPLTHSLTNSPTHSASLMDKGRSFFTRRALSAPPHSTYTHTLLLLLAAAAAPHHHHRSPLSACAPRKQQVSVRRVAAGTAAGDEALFVCPLRCVEPIISIQWVVLVGRWAWALGDGAARALWLDWLGCCQQSCIYR
ncbi:hypothetical protein IWZ03DRAFT_371620 [Phyllosticta citriasiana]|uniref:Uncharacterized protein n=1 Tax=Phyllosticta citriasiana TaxID=595635 RepID=A0ABR1KSY2_9PEZI